MGSGVSPLILGVSGTRLTDDERGFIAERRPLGFILFARNIETPEQTKALTAELSELSVTPFPLIAVDQEGGRVQRITFGGRLPPARVFGDWFEVDSPAALEACKWNAFLLSSQLRDVGANWLMGPVLDLALPETHGIIGDRAFSGNPQIVAALGEAYLEGIRLGGGFGCIKHAPGHGRATVDSHQVLPRVLADRELLQNDFYPFSQLASRADALMTAHICFDALDNEPVTTSSSVLAMMRNEWGLKGLIIADDIGMEALSGTYTERAQRALAAGCDVVITALSLLKHGMAGAVFDVESYRVLKEANLPELNLNAWGYVRDIQILPAPDIEMIAHAKSRLAALWAGGPARMGYTLSL